MRAEERWPPSLTPCLCPIQYIPVHPTATPQSTTVLQQCWLCLGQVCPAWFQQMQFALPFEKYPPISLLLPPPAPCDAAACQRPVPPPPEPQRSPTSGSSPGHSLLMRLFWAVLPLRVGRSAACRAEGATALRAVQTQSEKGFVPKDCDLACH